MINANYRYPGSKPFFEDDRKIFFGREDDINKLFKYITVENLVVLYGKSGLGKTSLLNAGILPKLQQESHYLPFPIRFKNYVKGNEQSPVEIFADIVGRDKLPPTFLDRVEDSYFTMWKYFKSLEINNGQKTKVILFLDQFEELFTYPQEGVEEFIRHLADLLNRKVPLSFKKILNRKMAGDDELLSEEELEMVMKPLDVKVVISIRSDKLSLLNRLKEYVPNILQNCYELNALTRQQAHEAIVRPASELSEAYISKPFSYSDAALDMILDFLTKKNEKNVESFQLQILCQYVERLVINDMEESYITADDIGDVEFIYKNYYELQIDEMCSDEAEKKASIRLIEEGLIFEDEERRISLYEGQIRAEFGVSEELLDKLVDSHLIRAEPSSGGGYTYELSHDTLVSPILQAKKKRKEDELWEKDEAERRALEQKQRDEEIRAAQLREEKLRKRALVVAVFSLGAIVILLIVFLPKLIRQNHELAAKMRAIELQKRFSDSLASTLESKVQDIAKLNNSLETLRTTEKGQLLDSLTHYQVEVKKIARVNEEFKREISQKASQLQRMALSQPAAASDAEQNQRITELEEQRQDLLNLLRAKSQQLNSVKKRLDDLDLRYSRLPLTSPAQVREISKCREEWRDLENDMEKIIEQLEGSYQ